MNEQQKQCTDCKCHGPAHESGFGKVGCQSKFALSNASTGDGETTLAYLMRGNESKCGQDGKWFTHKGN